jgi:hypothetical protein
MVSNYHHAPNETHREVTMCTTYFNILKLCKLPTECISVFHVVLKVNIDYFSKQH